MKRLNKHQVPSVKSFQLGNNTNNQTKPPLPTIPTYKPISHGLGNVFTINASSNNKPYEQQSINPNDNNKPYEQQSIQSIVNPINKDDNKSAEQYTTTNNTDTTTNDGLFSTVPCVSVPERPLTSDQMNNNYNNRYWNVNVNSYQYSSTATNRPSTYCSISPNYYSNYFPNKRRQYYSSSYCSSNGVRTVNTNNVSISIH